MWHSHPLVEQQIKQEQIADAILLARREALAHHHQARGSARARWRWLLLPVLWPAKASAPTHQQRAALSQR